MKRSPEWTPDEDAIVREFYPTGGWRAVQARLPHRVTGAIYKRAKVLNAMSRKASVLKRRAAVYDDAAVPLPRHDLLEQLDCVRLRNWRGPVTFGLVGARIAA